MTSSLTSTRTRRGAYAVAHAALVATFVCYLVLLVWAVLWKFGDPHIAGPEYRQLKLVPFVSTEVFGPSAPLEVAANFVLFAPFGALLALIAPEARWWRAGAAAALASLLLESAQYALAVGSADSTDVIVNTAGGLAGFLVVAGFRAGDGRATSRVRR